MLGTNSMKSTISLCPEMRKDTSCSSLKLRPRDFPSHGSSPSLGSWVGTEIHPAKTFKLIPGHRLHLLWHPCCPQNTWTTGRGYNWWSSGFIQRIQRSRLSIFPSFGLYCTLHTLHVAPEARVRKEGVGGATINFTKIILKSNRMSLKGLQWVSREKHEGILSNQ